MKKNIIKLLMLFLVVSINFVAFVGKISVDANEGLYQEVSRNEVSVLNDVIWTNIIANTKTTRPSGSEAGYGSTDPIDPNKWYGQQINVLSVPRVLDAEGNQKYQIIEWSTKGDEQWNFRGMTAMAVDFEQQNPDYIVLGGINGDFYDWHTTKDYPNSGTGIEVSEGEVLRAIRTGTHAVGVKNNDDSDQLVFVSNTQNHFSSNPYLTIYDTDGNELKEIELNGINTQSLNDGETSAYFPHLEIIYAYDENGNHLLNTYNEWLISERKFHAPTLADGNTYVVINGERVIYQADEGSYYGKGSITNVNDGTQVQKNSFAIVTKNQEISSLLAKDVVIRVQYKITDAELAESDNIMGCGEMLIEDGVLANYSGDSYYYTRAPRTIIGCKADGTVCLITMDGRQADSNYYGTNQEEINTILQELDIDDAYLLDGGGSTTFFIRENEQFIIKNSPSDGQQRSVSNGFLIVTKKDDSVKIADITKTNDSLTFVLDLNSMSDSVVNSYITVNGETKQFVDGHATFNNLESNTEYSYTLQYDTNEFKNIPTTTVSSATTNKDVPIITLGELKEDDSYFYPSFEINDPDSALQLVEINLINKETLTVVDSETYSFDEPDKVIKLEKSSNVNEYKCTMKYYYRTGVGQKLEIIEVDYTIPVKDADEGCSSGTLVLLPTFVLAASLLLIYYKKNN